MGHRSSVPDIFSLLFFILDTAGAASWQLLFMKTNRFTENSTFMPSFPVSGKCKVVSEGGRHLAEVLELTWEKRSETSEGLGNITNGWFPSEMTLGPLMTPLYRAGRSFLCEIIRSRFTRHEWPEMDLKACSVNIKTRVCSMDITHKTLRETTAHWQTLLKFVDLQKN